MTFDEIIAKFIGSQLGSSANKRTAIYFKNLLEDNKTTLDLENSSLSDKMYLYLLYHIDHHQRVVYDTIRNAKKVEDISDDAMIDVFNELISEYSSYSYNRDKLTTYFLSFKTEIDKRPMVGANLVLAGFDIVAKTNNVIKDDQEYARFVDRKVSYPTKQYIKYLTEDNMQYFVMQDVITEGNHRYNAPTISLDNCSIEFKELRDANGMYFTVPTIISAKYELNKLIFPDEKRIKYAAPTATDGIK